MKAIQVTKFGGPEVLDYATVKDPEPGPDQVLIRVRTLGVNFADIKARTGGYHLKREFPFVPGIDASGTIEEVGREVKNLKKGMRVVAFPVNGSYSEYVVAREMLTFPIPDTISDETAAAFPIVAGTSYAMLARIARLQPGESVLVHSAAGGVGTTAVQIAKDLGSSPLFATVGSDDKKVVLQNLGVDTVMNYRTNDTVNQVLDLTAGKGVDVILNPLGGDILEKDLECLAPFGRLICFGHAGGQSARISTDKLHGTSRSIIGFSFGSMRKLQPEAAPGIMAEVIALVAKGKINMILGKRFPLREAAAAHRYMESRQSTGKILLTA
jgi:NADPH2:quinone reductase